jgi:cytochrome c oxidase cbb3-type subunit 3
MSFNLLLRLTVMWMLAFFSASAFADIDEGRELFYQHCVNCHGVNGAGSIGLPLSRPSIIKSLTNDYIRYTIREGRPGRLMPAFTTLEESQVDSIVEYMRSWGEVELIADQAAGFKGDPAKGAVLYEEKCSTCHGDNLAGSEEGTGVTFSRKRSLSIMPPALNNSAFQDAISDRALLHVIQEGREGTPMHAFRKKLSHKETHHLIAYIRSQRKEKTSLAETDKNFTLFMDSPYSFDETVKRIREIVSANNFRVFPERYLEQGLTDEFSVNKRQIIIRFCNFNKLFDALKIEPRLGTILPCKVTVIEKEDGSVQLVYANVSALATLFNNDRLSEAFEEIEQSYNDILDEVTL